MEEQAQKTKAGMGLGIGGFVCGIVALVISFIPCLGMYAIFPGIVAIILSAIGLYQANKGNGPKGLIIAALCVSVVGTAIAGWQYVAFKRASAELEKWTDSIDVNMKDAMQDLSKELNNLNEDLKDSLNPGVDTVKKQ